MEREAFPLDRDLEYSRERDYLRSAVNILQRQGLRLGSGWDCRVTGTIPINSGTASSSALVVAWIAFLLKAAGDRRASDPDAIAELAFQAEVAEFHEPGGRMDHYAAAVGGVISVHFQGGLRVIRHPNPLGEFVLADSLIQKDTTGTLGYIKSNVLSGLERVRRTLPGFDLSSPLGDEERDVISGLPEVERRLLEGTLRTRDITARGERLFDESDFDHHRFGRLLNEQQEVVRDFLQISVSKIDRMIETALSSGALGAKINGSGQGGCIFAYAPGRGAAVAEALEALDTRTVIVGIGPGVTVE
jgi:galactokinase